MNIKKYIFNKWAIIALAVLLVGAGIVALMSNNKPQVETIVVKNATVSEEVSITGRVTPFLQSEVGFEKGGTVAGVNIKVGDKVRRGATLASLSDRPTYAALLSARANLAAAEANLADNQTNTAIDFENAKRKAIDAARSAYVKVDSAMRNEIDPEFFTNGSSVNPSLVITAQSNTARRAVENGRYAVTLALEEWNRSLTSGPVADDAPEIIAEVRSYMTTINEFMANISKEVTYVSRQSGLSQTLLDGYVSTMHDASTDINTAMAEITAADNELSSNAPKSVKALEAKIDQAKADVANYQAQYAKSLIVAPFDGIITKVDIQPGDSVAMSQSVVSIMGNQAFKVEANVAEADIAKVKVGQSANITLDAYGSDVVFEAEVVSIDPAETIVEGVPTYKTSLQFKKDDERIKSGMTADIDIKGEVREDVLAIPQRTIVSKNDGKYVTIKTGDTTQEVKVTTGLRGSDGSVEIVGGLKAGDLVVINQPE